MSKQKWSSYFKDLLANIRGSILDDEGGGLFRREKVIVFMFSYGIAMILWLLVNLSRPFNLTVTLPVDLEGVPAGKALANDVPHEAAVNVNGEGWKLLRIYNNPPRIKLRPMEGTMNFFDVVREQMNVFAGVDVTKVTPASLEIKLENRITKKVPVVANVLVKPNKQFGMVGWPKLTPDSVMVSGATSILQNINSWPTEYKEVKDVDDNINLMLNLKKPDQILAIDPEQVSYQAKVEEFTDGEVKVDIRTSNLPNGQRVSYSPTSITIRYGIPINEYSGAQHVHMFQVYVPYQDILSDTTGFVAPLLALRTDSLHVRIRDYQPHRVAYYTLRQK